MILKYLSIIIIFLILTQKINYFIAFYILTPILIAVNIVFFKNKELIMGGMTLIKGIYYIGVIIISLIQYLCESSYATELALGFTLSLAIFESITAISNGYSKLESAKNKL